MSQDDKRHDSFVNFEVHISQMTFVDITVNYFVKNDIMKLMIYTIYCENTTPNNLLSKNKLMYSLDTLHNTYIIHNKTVNKVIEIRILRVLYTYL